MTHTVISDEGGILCLQCGYFPCDGGKRFADFWATVHAINWNGIGMVPPKELIPSVITDYADAVDGPGGSVPERSDRPGGALPVDGASLASSPDLEWLAYRDRGEYGLPGLGVGAWRTAAGGGVEAARRCCDAGAAFLVGCARWVRALMDACRVERRDDPQ